MNNLIAEFNEEADRKSDAAASFASASSRRLGKNSTPFLENPWDGAEELAKEDMVEWFMDFSRRRAQSSTKMDLCCSKPALEVFAESSRQEDKLRGTVEKLLFASQPSHRSGLPARVAGKTLRGWGASTGFKSRDGDRTSVDTTISTAPSLSHATGLTLPPTDSSLATKLSADSIVSESILQEPLPRPSLRGWGSAAASPRTSLGTTVSSSRQSCGALGDNNHEGHQQDGDVADWELEVLMYSAIVSSGAI